MTICHRTGKRAYPGPNSARKANRTARFRVFVYRCEFCAQWHCANGSKRDR